MTFIEVSALPENPQDYITDTVFVVGVQMWRKTYKGTFSRMTRADGSLLESAGKWNSEVSAYLNYKSGTAATLRELGIPTPSNYERFNVLNAAESIIEHARMLQTATLGRPRTAKVLMELEHDLQDALKSVQALRAL